MNTRRSDLHVSGTVNEIKDRSLSYGLMARLLMACDGAWTAGR
jgi:hypothetical protein